jgi:hypothetical protein
MVVALIALFVALGGTGIAARHYLITSTGQIKPSVLRVLRGRAGPQGPQGPAGTPASEGLVHLLEMKVRFLEGEMARVKENGNGLCKGIFTAKINALGQLGATWEDIYKTLLTIENEVPHACVF